MRIISYLYKSINKQARHYWLHIMDNIC